MKYDKISEKTINHYVRTSASYLICSDKSKKEFIYKSTADISNFLEENDPNSFDEIIQLFGTPKQMADNFMETLSENEMMEAKRKAKAKKLILIFLCSLGVVLTLCLGAYLLLRPTITVTTTIYSDDTLSEAYQSYISNSEQSSTSLRK